MSTFLMAYALISYVFSGAVCYTSARKNQHTNNPNNFQSRGWIVLFWPLWIGNEIDNTSSLNTSYSLVEERIEPQEKVHPSKPIGQVLEEAGLLTQNQVQAILAYQQDHRYLRFGEISAMWGWIKSETADFFAERLYQFQAYQQPLGQSLKGAGILDDEQIKTILTDQLQTGLRFGEIAVRHGWVNQKTVDFFVGTL
ncbi:MULTISPECIES: hypothetical protein [unclassified Roseofilum]|uniref:hypothetical protein n=1 Tax=unclassified Roseofilum TaxID=2620099 RepID=UPI001B11D377|nr:MULTISPECIES: hypothetical protein [unclassified Roseofilum]MBP0009669.1 hypothetical protein [Roseofilum sp. Belize Diploria]MBP0034019.1 hypothetical protein [Roseofilum sp. Belize BBD 4]